MQKLLPLLVLVLCYPFSATAQTTDPALNKQIVEARNYVFIAQSAIPQRGGMIQLTSAYDLTVTRDTITAFLPYFGRAFTAPVGSAEGGIKFTSTNFDYTVASKKKKGRWEINIRPGDVADSRRLTLIIFDNGQASLQVTSLNRQSISFNGYIVEGKKTPKAF